MSFATRTNKYIFVGVVDWARLCLVITLLYMLSACGNAAEKNSVDPYSLFVDPALKNITRVMATVLEDAVRKYKFDLTKAKRNAVESAMPYEVELINKALNNEMVTEFTSDEANGARTEFEKNLVEIARKYGVKLNGAVVLLLRQERVDDAKSIKKVFEYVTYNADALSQDLGGTDKSKQDSAKDSQMKVTKNFTIDANKDWQNTGVMVPPGTDVTVKANGRWSPGDRDSVKFKSAGADTYNYEFKIQSQNETAFGGESWIYKCKPGGQLLARMKDYSPESRANAQGSVVVKLMWLEKSRISDNTKKSLIEPLEHILARYTPDGGLALFGKSFRDDAVGDAGNGKKQKPSEIAGSEEADSSQAKLYKKNFRLKVYAAKDWQIYPIDILKGDKISITAEGNWTPDKKVKENADADTYGYSIRVGSKNYGAAGKEYSLTSDCAGKLILRIDSHDWIVESGATPAGAIELCLSIERNVQ